MVLSKVKRRAQSESRRWALLLHDSLFVTFSEKPESSLRSYISSPLTSKDPQLRSAVENYKQHTFDLLGSGWQKVDYGVSCKGFEEYKYGPSPKVNADREGEWLRGRVTAPNLPQARRIWQMV